MAIDEAPRARIVIAGGGTGGHLTPALALARELADRGCDVLLIGAPRGPDREVLPRSGFPFRILPAPSLQRGRWWRNVKLPIALAIATLRARRMLTEFRAGAAVGTGGYVTVPVILAARTLDIPILLQEQNRIPGVATRFLSRWARRVCVQFGESAEALRGVVVEVTGSPIAAPVPAPSDFADQLDPARLTVGVFGGSQGAAAINDAMIELLAGRTDGPPYNLVWQTGAADHARVAAAAKWPERFVVRPFFTPMAAVYPHLDLVVCRAGAMTLAEVTAWGLPSILIPYPFATDDHQMLNARAVERAGGAVVLPQGELDPRTLADTIEELLTDEARRRAIAASARSLGRPDAAARVAARVLELVSEQS